MFYHEFTIESKLNGRYYHEILFFYKEDVLFYFGHNVFILVLCIYKSVSGYGILYMDK